MKKTKRSWERLTDEEKAIVKQELILFFENERGEKIGTLAAEEIINFFLQTAGNKIYNKGVMDAKKAISNRIDELQFDLDDLLAI